jgi:hypothetical protein
MKLSFLPLTKLAFTLLSKNGILFLFCEKLDNNSILNFDKIIIPICEDDSEDSNKLIEGSLVSQDSSGNIILITKTIASLSIYSLMPQENLTFSVNLISKRSFLIDQKDELIFWLESKEILGRMMWNPAVKTLEIEYMNKNLQVKLVKSIQLPFENLKEMLFNKTSMKMYLTFMEKPSHVVILNRLFLYSFIPLFLYLFILYCNFYWFFFNSVMVKLFKKLI